MNYIRSNNVSLNYQRFTTLGYKDIGDYKIRVCGKFLCSNYVDIYNDDCVIKDLHMVEMEDFKYGGTNITAFRLVNPSSELVQGVIIHCNYLYFLNDFLNV